LPRDDGVGKSDRCHTSGDHGVNEENRGLDTGELGELVNVILRMDAERVGAAR
jgi:hypothetical protein